MVALVVKNLPASAGDTGDAGPNPGLGRSPGEGRGNTLQYSCLENPVVGGALPGSCRKQSDKTATEHADTDLVSGNLTKCNSFSRLTVKTAPVF